MQSMAYQSKTKMEKCVQIVASTANLGTDMDASPRRWLKKPLGVALLALATLPLLAAAYQMAARFTTEREAQQHCPADTVVWVNLPTGVYHFKGQRWYGNTKSGAYECRREADLEGSRPTHNRQ